MQRVASRLRAVGAALLLVLAATACAHAAPPPGRIAALRRGINITGWFRAIGDRGPAATVAYLSGAAIRGLRAAGFTFVRLPFDPGFGATPALRRLLISQARRLEKAGLAVMLVPRSSSWRLESRAADRAALIALWDALAPALRDLPTDLTFPELVNEPVFTGEAQAWNALERTLLARIRAALPESTVILSGPDWSSIEGLLATAPLADRNVVYSVHYYDPPELTSLAAYRPGLDRAALGRLPFPMTDPRACSAAAASKDAATASLAAFVCAQRWDASRVATRIAQARAWGQRNGSVVLVSEFGASAALNREAREAWLRAVRQACEAAGFGWALWGYDDVMGFDLPRPPPPAPRLDPGVLQALGMTSGN